MAGMAGLQTAPPVRQRHDAGLGLRARHRQPVGQPAHRRPGHLPRRAGRSCTSTSSRPRSAGCSPPTTASSPTPAPRWNCSSRWPGSAGRPAGCADRSAWVGRLPGAQAHHAAAHPLRQRPDQAAAGVRGDEQGVRPRTPGTSAPSACRRSPAAQFLHVYKPRHWINAGQAGPLGWTLPAALGVCVADPDATVVALSGDYDFQFMIEELAVGAQFNLPYIHVLVNNAYLGLIRQSQRGFDMDYCVQLAFDNINTAPPPTARDRRLRRRPRQGGRGLGCKAVRVQDPEELAPALETGQEADGRVPGAGGGRGHPGAGHQHLDGRRDRQRRRVRGSGPTSRRTRRPPSSPCWTDSRHEPDRGRHRMKILVAPDKFKGSMRASDVAAHVAAGISVGVAGRRGDHRSRSPTAATAPWTPPWPRAFGWSR